MKRILVLVFFIVLWSAIIFYMVQMTSYHKQRRAEVVCNAMIVNVKDSTQRSFLSSQIVGELLSSHDLNPRGKGRNEIDINAIENYLASVMYVKDVDVYITMEGNLHIDLLQRRPYVRFIAQGGYDFYISDDNNILPISDDYLEYVPVVSGDINLPFAADYFGPIPTSSENKGLNDEKKFAENSLFLRKLINFVGYIETDKFWDAQIVQISVTEGVGGREPTLELVPRIGSHTILLGHVDGYKTKLEKMRDCYLHGMDTTIWNKFSKLDIQYSGQIVGIE